MISGRAKIAGVMGWPVSHSRSPLIHNHWLSKLGLDGAYVPFAVAPDDLEAAVAGLRTLGCAGANVTIPHKVAVMDFVDEVDDTARAIGAVNTLYFDESRRLIGSNTDGFGFIENLKAADGLDPSRPALVLGAGGAARAILWALGAAGFPEIRLVNRSRDKANALADVFSSLPISVSDWTERSKLVEGTGLLVNTTSLGMTGQPPLEIDLPDGLPPMVVNDLVYAPLETDLLSRAAARGHKAVDGLGMLLHQARPGFEKWFGPLPDVTTALRELCMDHLNRSG